MVDDWCLVCGVCGLLFAVCCLRCVVSLFVVWCLLVVGCWLIVVGCCVLLVACWM